MSRFNRLNRAISEALQLVAKHPTRRHLILCATEDQCTLVKSKLEAIEGPMRMFADLIDAKVLGSLKGSHKDLIHEDYDT